MFKNLGKIKYNKSSIEVGIELKKIQNGINFTEEFIIYKKKVTFLFMTEFVIIIVES